MNPVMVMMSIWVILFWMLTNSFHSAVSYLFICRSLVCCWCIHPSVCVDSCKDKWGDIERNPGFVTIVTKGFCQLGLLGCGLWVVAMWVLHPSILFSFRIASCLAYCTAHRFAICLAFWDGGGVGKHGWRGGAPQTQKRVVLALVQVFDPPHVFITVLH